MNFTNIPLLLGSSAAAGLNLYLTLFSLGVAGKFGLLDLPERIQFISNPILLGILFILVILEFFADKIPYIDTAWDFLHTFLRPLGAAVMGFLIAPEDSPGQIIMATAAAGLALTTHSAKAGTRVVANTSPEPLSNTALSLAEDGIVLTIVYLIINHPVIAIIAAVMLIVISVIMIYFAFRIAGGIFRWILGEKRKEPSA